MHKITTVFNYFTAVIINMFANNRMSCVSSKWQKKAAACFDGGSLREAQEGKYDTFETRFHGELASFSWLPSWQHLKKGNTQKYSNIKISLFNYGDFLMMWGLKIYSLPPSNRFFLIKHLPDWPNFQSIYNCKIRIWPNYFVYFSVPHASPYAHWSCSLERLLQNLCCSKLAF